MVVHDAAHGLKGLMEADKATTQEQQTHPSVNIEHREEEKKIYVSVSKSGPYPAAEDVIGALRFTGTPYWIDESTITSEIERCTLEKQFVAAYARDAEVQIQIEKNDRSANLIVKPAYGGDNITPDQILSEIEKSGIVFGVDFDSIRNTLEAEIYDKPVMFAQAREPVHGVDARICYEFQLEYKMTPKELEHEKVDYKELQMVFAVNKDETVARKIPATTGEEGCTIKGKPMPAKPGKDVSLVAGRNAVVAPDGLSICAKIDGQPMLKGKNVFVEPVLTVEGDVDYSVGNINFKGSVRILGSVISGFTVKATEDIQIDGVVEDAFIEAGRDLSIKGGVLGAEKGSISAGRDIHMSFVENCVVEAGRNIFVGDMLNSNISAGDTIDAILGKGRVFGGKLNARNLVTTNILGSGAAEKTQVSVGYEPKTVARLKNLDEVLAKVRYTHEEITKHISTLENLRRSDALSEEKRVLYQRLIATEEELRHNIEELNGEIDMLKSTMTKAVQPIVKVRKTCYPNVRIKIGRLVLDCFEEYNSAVFFEEDEKIKVNVYENFV